MELNKFIRQIPKAELHLHIEGSFEPELMFKIADRNKIKIKYNSVDELKTAYNFNNLQEFLDIYYAGANVLQTEKDFYDLTWAYLEKAHSQNIVHTEIMFDPQTHTERGIPFPTVIEGIHNALADAEKKFGITSKLIMSFLRHLDENSAFETLETAKSYKNKIAAIGLDSSEVGNPPSKFKNVFAEAQKQGYLVVTHAGEEGPPEYVWEALNLLHVNRIDHGNRSLEDKKLVVKLVEQKIPLTVCPLSNIKLCNVDKIENHPIKTMLNLGLIATVNSDDPAYFGGYVNENFIAVSNALNLTKQDIYLLAKNSFDASFIGQNEKEKYIISINLFLNKYS